MALDPLEKERLRRKMADRMALFLSGAPSVSCVSGHVYDEPNDCELCARTHAVELLVIKNRAAKKLRVSSDCILEMIRFKVAEVDELPRWLAKLKELRVESERRKKELEEKRAEERQKLEKRVIVRKRPAENGLR